MHIVNFAHRSDNANKHGDLFIYSRYRHGYLENVILTSFSVEREQKLLWPKWYLLRTAAFHSSSFTVFFLSLVSPFANKVNPQAASWHLCRGYVLLCFSVVKRSLFSVMLLSPSCALLVFLLMNRARGLSDLAQANSISRECGRSHGMLATSRLPMAERGRRDRLIAAYEALREASINGALYWYTVSYSFLIYRKWP